MALLYSDSDTLKEVDRFYVRILFRSAGWVWGLEDQKNHIGLQNKLNLADKNTPFVKSNIKQGSKP